MTDNSTALLNLIATHSFRLGDFTLASGQKSDYYIDCRTTTLHAEGGRLSGLVLYDLIREHFPQAEAVGGLTMGADPLVSNTASASAWAVHDHGELAALIPEEDLDQDLNAGPAEAPTLIHGFLVRKAEKTHGLQRRIEGPEVAGKRVLAVEDTSTTGGSVLAAVDALQAAGAEVVGVAVLVERGARPAIAGRGLPYRAVFELADLFPGG